MKNSLIILAGGIGSRMRKGAPKQFIKFGSNNFIEYFLSNLDTKIFDIILISLKKEHRIRYLSSIKQDYRKHHIIFCEPGITRQETVRKSLIKLEKFKPQNVLIHDSARPLASNILIKKIILSLNKNSSAIPYIQNYDLIKNQKNNEYIKHNKRLMNIQTPQGFTYKKILLAHKKYPNTNARDDSIMFEKIKIKNYYIKGEKSNLKITCKEDLKLYELLKKKEFRHGIGYDIHKIDNISKKKLTLCGVKINHKPLIGHSDADVGYHAICDSIFGALSMKDIGYYFNNKNQKWKNINSSYFMKFCKIKLKEKNFEIINLDINFICETPNINKISNNMRKNISELLDISSKIISIKATTNEKIGLIGKGEGIAAESIVQVSYV